MAGNGVGEIRIKREIEDDAMDPLSIAAEAGTGKD